VGGRCDGRLCTLGPDLVTETQSSFTHPLVLGSVGLLVTVTTPGTFTHDAVTASELLQSAANADDVRAGITATRPIEIPATAKRRASRRRIVPPQTRTRSRAGIEPVPIVCCAHITLRRGSLPVRSWKRKQSDWDDPEEEKPLSL
jgi:hypothetical protein